MVGRILPGRMEVWRRKRDRQRDRKASAREKRMREWVSEKLRAYTHVEYYKHDDECKITSVTVISVTNLIIGATI